MIAIVVYLTALIIAPQLWVQAVLNWSVDFFIYPFWMFVLLLRGRIGEFFRLRTPDLFFLAYLLWMIMSWLTNPAPSYAALIFVNYFKWLRGGNFHFLPGVAESDNDPPPRVGSREIA